MKRKNQFILIGIVVLIIFIFLITKLLSLNTPISENHIGLKFEIHNCSSVEKNKTDLRDNFLKPLLKYFLVKSKTETKENLYLNSIKLSNFEFCIPAKGINAIRYNSKSENLQESSMTSTSRNGDEESFFNNWDGGEKLSFIERNLLKSNPKVKKLPSLNEIKRLDELDEIFIDSFIIDKNCSNELIENNKPYIFKSTNDLMSYIKSELEKNPSLIEKGTVNKTIHIFIYCDENYSKNENDIDNDGISNHQDKCPTEKGDLTNFGCPVKTDTDKDGVIDSIDKCPRIKGEKQCDGCPCPKPPKGPDNDKDGVQDDKDKCPNEFGFARYKGCPIPDTDSDGVNDEIDKCQKEKGTFANNGCPLKISITHNNKDGRFIVNGTSNLNDYDVSMNIKQSNGKIVNHQFSGYVCPTKDEAKKITNLLSDPVDLLITIIIKDKTGKEINRSIFSNLSMICFSDQTCGFVDLDKN